LGFDLLAICAVILLINWWQSDSRNSQSSAAGARSALLDNAKVLGSCLVIYNHCMYNAVEAATGPIVPVSLLMNRHFSYLVNPTFVFVSGITSQGGPTVKRIRRYIQFLVIPTILFQTLVNPYFVQNLVDLKPSNIPHQIQHFQHDLWQKISHLPDWYLLSLCLWRGLTYAVWSHVPKYVSFPMMVFLSCAAGYIEFPDMMNPFFSYMPIFGFGYCFPLAAMERAVPKPNQIVSACVLVMVGVWVSVIMPGLFPAPPGSDPFTGVLPDSHNWYGEADAQFETALPWDYALWWSRRLTKLFADMVSPLSLIFFVLPRQETFLTYAGQHTLYSYLTQRVLFSWREKIFLLLPVWDQQHHVIYLTGFIGQCLKEAIYIPFTIFVFVVVTSSYWRPIFSWGLSPKWMDPYMDRIESSVSNMLGYDELGKEKQRSEQHPYLRTRLGNTGR
jgi:fucose 4-O-acetylase-like acetyltransferase